MFIVAGILSSVLIISITKCQTFTSVPPIPTYYPETCGPPHPQNSTDCTQNNTIFQYCCYLTPLSGGPGFCQPITPTKWQQQIKTWVVNGTTYNLACDIVPGSQASPCGVVNPTQPSDCTKASTSTNSCCFYSNLSLNVTGFCIWMGFYSPVSPIPQIVCSASSTPQATVTTTVPEYGGDRMANVLYSIFAFLFLIIVF